MRWLGTTQRVSIEMQNLRKRFSLDCQVRQQRQHHHQMSTIANSGSGFGDGEHHQNLSQNQQQQQRTLAHSVSIVVEPAKEAPAQLDNGEPRLLDSLESSSKELSLEKKDEDDDDGEEEEEADACLRSELARRVVLVDEVEGIFIRNRAQSAEPSALSACCRRFASPSSTGNASSAASNDEQRRSESASPPALGDTIGQPQQCLHRSRFSSLGRPDLSFILSSANSTSSASAAGVCELAERGALSNLGMRRNTHHHLVAGQSFHNGSPNCLGGASAVLAMRSASSSLSGASAARSATGRLQFQTAREELLGCLDNGSKFSKQHRRQSLQISLLTGGHYKDTGHSLTEEELRGEREFNEQVRSAAKSPEIKFKQQQQHISQSQVNTLSSATSSPIVSTNFGDYPAIFNSANRRNNCNFESQASHLKLIPKISQSGEQINRLTSPIGSHLHQRSFDSSSVSKLSSSVNPSTTSSDISCSSASSSRRSSFLNNNNNTRLGLIDSGQNQANSIRQTSPIVNQRVRRVSFGSIDPIVLNSDERSAFEKQRGANLLLADRVTSARQESRASIGGCGASLLLTRSQQHRHSDSISTQTSTTSGILRRLERAGSSTAQTFPVVQQQQQSSLSASKRHSLAATNLNSFVAQQQTSAAWSTMSQERMSQSSDKNNNKPTIETQARSGGQEKMDGVRKREGQDMATASTKSAVNLEDLAIRRTRFASVAGDSAGDICVKLSGLAEASKLRCSDDDANDQKQQDHGKREQAMEELVASQAARKHQSKSIGGEQGSLHDASRVQSIMANARLRQEEFAKLLEEHEQIVNEINRFETKISTTNATNSKQVDEQQRKSSQMTPSLPGTT